MYRNKIMLGIGAVAVVLAMSACEKSEAPKTVSQTKPAVAGLTDFQQKISMKSPLTEMKPGEVVTPEVTITNTSNVDWPITGTTPVNLSYHWVDKSQKMAIFDGERTALPAELKAGASVDLHARIKAPSHPGDYILQLTMVQENVAWFDNKGANPLSLPVKVK